MLCKIDEHGKPKKVMKIKKGKKEKLEVDEGEVFFALGKKKKKRRAMINNNTVYTVMAENDGDNKVIAGITNGAGKKPVIVCLQASQPVEPGLNEDESA